MLNIRCPWCGDRAQIEFTCHGDATVVRPQSDASADAWYDFVYTRENPCGVHWEWWHHTAGCRKWIKVKRNTLTHEILATEFPESDWLGEE